MSPQASLFARLAMATSAAALLVGCLHDGAEAEASSATQGWSDEARLAWSNASQGSRLMPLAWFKALAQPGGTAPFMADDHLASFRIVPQAGRLPIGFAIDRRSDRDFTVSRLQWFAGQDDRQPWIGLNCSACHTAVIEHGGKQHRIDGGPALFDFQAFIEALDRSLHETLDSAAASGASQARFDQFARKVFCDQQATCATDTPQNRAQLREALTRLVAWEDRVERMNQTSVRYGYGRVDAFGHIFNKISLFNGAANPTPNPASAPVSYPYLWDIYRHDFLQWNGIAENKRLSLGGSRYLDYGALGRNTGEVIGVFGDVAVTPNPGLKGYRSSVDVANLERMERLLTSLKAPKWPEAFDAGEDAQQRAKLVPAGQQLFGEHCASCHAPQPGTTRYKVTLVPLRQDDPNATDPWMACNAIRYTSPPGNLAGVPIDYVGNGPRYGNEPAPVASMLATTVKGTLIGKKGQVLAQAGRVFLGGGGLPRVTEDELPTPVSPVIQACFDANNPLFRYKARPLDGIWATAPYLHNGSVPNLYQLLLPPAQRVRSFPVGTRQYDPRLVGYRTDPQAAGNTFTFNTALPGNSNAGHDYGAGRMNDEQRMALLAYLKTL